MGSEGNSKKKMDFCRSDTQKSRQCLKFNKNQMRHLWTVSHVPYAGLSWTTSDNTGQQEQMLTKEETDYAEEEVWGSNTRKYGS